MRRVFVPFRLHDVFPDLDKLNPIDVLRFRLRQMSRVETLRYCIALNLFVSNPEHPLHSMAEQLPLMHMFVNDRVTKKIIDASTSLRTERHGDQLQRTVFERQQLLELMCQAVVNCPDSGKYSSPVQNERSKRRFLESALAAGEMVYPDLGYEQNLARENRQETRMRLLRLLRLSARASHAMDPVRAYGRGRLMFANYLPKEFPGFETEFQTHSGLSLSEYYACHAIVMTSYLDNQFAPRANHVIRVQEWCKQLPHMAAAFVRYLDLESHTVESLSTALRQDIDLGHNGFKPIRQKPLLRFVEGDAMVMDPVFHVEKAIAGPLFMLTGHIKDLLPRFGNAFQKYAENILREMFPQDRFDLRVADDLLLMTPEGKVEITDACLIDADRLLLFEVKAVWIR